MPFLSAFRPKNALLAIAAGALGVAALGAGTASADTHCGGSNSTIAGQGSSLQRTAQVSVWNSRFNVNTLGCTAATAPRVTYTSSSSGTGLRAWGSDGTGTVTTAWNFIGTDDAPTSTQRTNMQRATGASGTGSTVLNIPVTQAGIAFIANPPASCTLPNGNTLPRLTNAQVERAFQGTTTAATSWASIGATGTGCTARIKRVVRADSSGTTYHVKHFLSLANSGTFCASPAGTSWTALQAPSLNTTWCNDDGTLVPSLAGGTGPGAGSGGGDEVKTVNNTTGSVGYAALADVNTNRTASTHIIWLQNNVGTYVNPDDGLGNSNCATGANSYAIGGVSGAGLPAPDGDWSNVYYVPGSSQYPLCALTYDLALQDYSQVWGATPGRTVGQDVRDYLSYVVATSGGQRDAANGSGYARLPSDVQTAATTGIARIGRLL